MDLDSRIVNGWFWHGVGTEAGWKVLMNGGGLRLPEPNGHAHDPGDYGHAVYFTNSKARARPYAARIDGWLALIKCEIALENALIFDWRKGSALDPKHPTNEQTEFFERLCGNPVHGTPEERRTAAVRWREYLLERGYDGVIVLRPEENEVAVYRPEQSIKSIRFDLNA
jgi:hypothetical protein